MLKSELGSSNSDQIHYQLKPKIKGLSFFEQNQERGHPGLLLVALSPFLQWS
jgi:hypothetical protein